MIPNPISPSDLRVTRLHPSTPPYSPTPPASADRVVGDLSERIRKVIELIRPTVQADGGDIEFVGLTPDNLVQIRMHGACVGCPSSTVTLQSGIERNLKAHIPEVRGIQAIE